VAVAKTVAPVERGEGKEKKGKISFHFFPSEHSLIRSILHPVPSSTCIYRYNTFDTAEWKLGVLITGEETS